MYLFHTWLPGKKNYNDYIHQNTGFENIEVNIRNQQQQFERNTNIQKLALYDYASKIIASKKQINSALEASIKQQERNSKTGRNQIISTIEVMQSDVLFCLGTNLIKFDYQNKCLKEALFFLQKNFETRINECFNRGFSLIAEGDYIKAIKYLEESIALPQGEFFFPSYYQLGRLHLLGFNKNLNIIDLEKSNKLLLHAYKLHPNSEIFYGDCVFFLSQSYWFQLKGDNNPEEFELLNNAINYCQNSTEVNPRLSIGYYYLAKYYSYGIGKFRKFQRTEHVHDELLRNYKLAINSDRNFLRALIPGDPLYDPSFDENSNFILDFIKEITNQLRLQAKKILDDKREIIFQIEDLNISESKKLASEYNNAKMILQDANNDYLTGTFFGYTDCIQKLNKI